MRMLVRQLMTTFDGRGCDLGTTPAGVGR